MEGGCLEGGWDLRVDLSNWGLVLMAYDLVGICHLGENMSGHCKCDHSVDLMLA